MHHFQIKCHKPGKLYPNTSHFFVLCKGENSGKPSKEPFVNSFVVICKTPEARQHGFFLALTMHEGTQVKPQLVGSVIPFIRVDDYRKLFRYHFERVQKNPEKWLQHMEAFRKLSQLQDHMNKQMQLIQRAKKAYCHI